MQPTLDWNQYCWISLSIQNTGQTVIEDLKIELEFIGEFKEVGVKRGSFFDPNFKNDVKSYSNSTTDLYIQPAQNTLVPNDGFVTGSFFIHTTPNAGGEIRILWKLLSRDFSESGSICVKIQPKFYVVIDEQTNYSDEELDEQVSYSLIKRPGMQTFDRIKFYDRESDYNFQ